jgi:thiamine-phosphate pyrophosphorylase
MVPLNPKIADARLLLIWTPGACALGPEETLRRAVAEGVDVVQVRVKEAWSRELYEVSLVARRIAGESCALFVNDRADVAIACGADGVHLGLDDLSIEEVRRIAPPGLSIGYSTHSLEQAITARERGADLLGYGPMFSTATKPHEPAVGPARLSEVCAAVDCPVFAIGGLTPERILAIGATRAAVSSAILAAADPARATREIRAALERNAD